MRKRNNVLKKAVAFFVCFSVFFTSVGLLTPVSTAESLSSLKSRESEIQSKIDNSEKKLAQLQAEKSEQQKIITQLNTQLSELSEKYEIVNTQKKSVDNDVAQIESNISSLNEEIDDLNLEIEEKEATVQDTIQMFCKRLRANYMMTDSALFQIIFNSSKSNNFMNRLELIKRVLNVDQNLVDTLNDEISEIEMNKEELTAKKEEKESEKEALVVKQSELGQITGELKSTMDTIAAKSAQVDENLKALNYTQNTLEDDISAYASEEARIQRAIVEAGGNTSGNGGRTSSKGFISPVKYGGAYISSGYGYRSASISGWSYHGGIDITGGSIYGQPVYASRSGTVIIAEKYSNSGYGHYVMIDHGDEYQTLYGHCSSVVVSYGQWVNQGDIIAYVGSTGNSTGPHLHFEVRYKNEKMNPLNYVSI